MRPRLPSSTVWAAVTGTATISAALRVAEGLGFCPGQYVNARYTIDRPNVKMREREKNVPHGWDQSGDERKRWGIVP
jgi:hypothetical protein